MVEYYPIAARDQARLYQFGKKLLLGIFLDYALIAGGSWNGDILITDIEELENFGSIRCRSRKIECERSPDNSKRRRICNCCGRWMVQQNCGKRLRIPGTHSEEGTNLKERRSHRRSSRRSGRVSTGRKQEMTLKPTKISGVCVPIAVPDLSTSSSSSSSTSPTMTSSTVSSDSVIRQARGDLCGVDFLPVTVSSEPVERQER